MATLTKIDGKRQLHDLETQVEESVKMTVPETSRTQRLRTLENHIRNNYESFIQTGNALREIRNDHLFKEAGFPNWEQYLKQRVSIDFGIEKSHVKRLIQCAEIRPKLPDLKSGPRVGQPSGWSIRAIQEFSRLVPEKEEDGRKKDYRNLKRVDATRVANAAFKLAGDDPVTAGHVRKAVDADLGIDRAKKAKETKAQQEHDSYIDIVEYLREAVGIIKGTTKVLARDVPADGWTLLAESHPNLAERLASACDELAELLRS